MASRMILRNGLNQILDDIDSRDPSVGRAEA
jgi:hypothetical protein